MWLMSAGGIRDWKPLPGAWVVGRVSGSLFSALESLRTSLGILPEPNFKSLLRRKGVALWGGASKGPTLKRRR
jgi:hypothetical protein